MLKTCRVESRIGKEHATGCVQKLAALFIFTVVLLLHYVLYAGHV